MEQITLRDVGNKEIYDSYMGILRISPSELDGSYIDSMSVSLTNPVDEEGNPREIILSDSDGIKLGAYFILRVRETDAVDGDSVHQTKNVINVVTKTDSALFVSNDLHVRSTLILNKKKQVDKIGPAQMYHESPYYIGSFDVVNYPIESPHDNSYFNSKNKLELIDYSNSKDVHTQLKEALYNKSKEWYDTNIKGEDRVKVGGKFIYTQNVNYEQIPVVYTKDYILGHYTGHTARITDAVKSQLIGQSIGPDRLVNEESVITRLSFIQLDKLVWDIVHEASQGNIRHNEGRYTLLGIGENESISERLFGQINPPMAGSPLLGMGVSPGIVMNHAMPFRRFIFHVLRQRLRNAEDEGNDNASLGKTTKKYVEAGKITPIAKQDPGFINTLTKEFVLCDGRELTYDNYPSVNTDSTNLFQHNDQGIVLRGDDNKPLPVDEKPPIYKAMENENGKVLVPSLLALEQQSPRYLRGENWLTPSIGVETPVNFELDLAERTFIENEFSVEVVKDSDYGLAVKNYSEPGLYRMNVDWKASGVRHKHYCFFNSKNYNRSQSAGNSVGSIGGATWFPTYSFVMPNPCYWNSLATTPPSKDVLMNYSFTKHKVSGINHITNTFGGHTPVPSAGIFAWKINQNGTMNDDAPAKLEAGEYVIQNAEETPISSDEEVRRKQLEAINFAEASAPIANKGGSDTGRGTYTSISCSKRKKSGRHNRLRSYYQAYTGGYFLQRAIDNDLEVPRCITSLSHSNIEEEKVEQPDPIKITMGNKVITPDTSLSFPPTLVLLPLFKI